MLMCNFYNASIIQVIKTKDYNKLDSRPVHIKLNYFCVMTHLYHYTNKFSWIRDSFLSVRNVFLRVSGFCVYLFYLTYHNTQNPTIINTEVQRLLGSCREVLGNNALDFDAETLHTLYCCQYPNTYKNLGFFVRAARKVVDFYYTSDVIIH